MTDLTRGSGIASVPLVIRRAAAVGGMLALVAVVGVVFEPQRSGGPSRQNATTVTLGSAPTALSFVQMRFESRGIGLGGTVAYEVEASSPDGSALRTMLSSTDQFNTFSELAWSLDGTKVAFARQFFVPGPGASIGHGEIVVMAADGSDQHVVRPCDHGPCITGLSWSPDGNRLAYIYRDSLGIMDADGANDRFVYQCRHDQEGCIGFLSGVAWSPDGSELLFSGEDRDNVGGLFLLNVDGGPIHPIVRCYSELCYGGDRDSHPAWSPDGSLIVFHRERNLFVVRPDGTGLTRLTDCPRTQGYSPCTADSPAWSPDGGHIAYTDGQAIYLTGPDGKGTRRLIQAPKGTATPSPGSTEANKQLSSTAPRISYSLCCLSWRPGGATRVVTVSPAGPSATPPGQAESIPAGVGTLIAPDDWPQFGGGPEHLGTNPAETAISPQSVTKLAQRWTSSVGNQALLAQSPTVVGGQLFVGGFDGNLYAFRAGGCETPECPPEWSGGTGGAIRSTPAVGLGAVFVGSSTGLFAFGASGCGRSTCSPLWRGLTRGPIEFSSPVLSGDRIFVGTSATDSRLYAFDAAGCGAATCSPLWTGSTLSNTGIWATPAVAGGFVYVRGADPYLYAFDAGGCGGRECRPAWKGRVVLGTSEAASAPVVAGGFVYVGSGDCGPAPNCGVYAFRAEGCGSDLCVPMWFGATEGGVQTASAVVGDTLLTTSPDGRLYAFHAAGCGRPRCHQLWVGKGAGDYPSSPVVAHGLVFVGYREVSVGKTGGIVAAFALGGCGAGTCPPVWTIATGAGSTWSPAISRGMLFVSGDDWIVHAIALS